LPSIKNTTDKKENLNLSFNHTSEVVKNNDTYTMKTNPQKLDDSFDFRSKNAQLKTTPSDKKTKSDIIVLASLD